MRNFWKKILSYISLILILTIFGHAVEAVTPGIDEFLSDYSESKIVTVNYDYPNYIEKANKPGVYRMLVGGSNILTPLQTSGTNLSIAQNFFSSDKVFISGGDGIMLGYENGKLTGMSVVGINNETGETVNKNYFFKGGYTGDQASQLVNNILRSQGKTTTFSDIATASKSSDLINQLRQDNKNRENEINKILADPNNGLSDAQKAALEKERQDLINARDARNGGLNAQQAEASASGAGGSLCNLVSGFNFLGCLAAFFNFILELFSVPLILAAYMFDFVINLTIGDFKEAVNGPLKAPIENVWNLIRNFSNLIFIATILYIALKTMLDAEGWGDRKLLMKVIAFAFLINFSLLFTKLAIDASNIATVEIYNGITKSLSESENGNIPLNQIAKVKAGSGLSQSLINFSGDNANASLAALFLNNMLISEVYDGSGQAISTGNIISNSLLGSIMLLVAAFTFFAISIAFIVRFFILVVLMMTSPIVFASNLLPGVDAQSKMWKENLISQCVFAPTFMIMIYIALQMLASTSSLLKDGGTTALFVNYILTIVSMIACLVVAGKAGAHAKSVEWGKKIGGALALGGVGFAGRRLIGGGLGGKLAKWGEGGIASNNGFAKIAGRLSLMAGSKLKDSSFDVRNISGASEYLGNGSKSNFNAINKERKDRAERERKIVEERTKLSAEEKIRLAQSDNMNHARNSMDSAKTDAREAAEKEKQAKETIKATLDELKNSGSAALKSQHDLLTQDIATANIRANDTNLSDADRQQARADLEAFKQQEKQVIARIKEEAKNSGNSNTIAKLKNLEDAEKAEKTNRERRIKANETIIAAQKLLSKSTEDLVKNLEKLGKLPKDIEKQIATAKAQGTPAGKAEAERLEKLKADAIKQDRAGIKKTDEDNKQAYLKWLQESSGGLVNSISYGSNMQNELNKYILDGLKGNSARELDKILKAIKEATKEKKENE